MRLRGGIFLLAVARSLSFPLLSFFKRQMASCSGVVRVHYVCSSPPRVVFALHGVLLCAELHAEPVRQVR